MKKFNKLVLSLVLCTGGIAGCSSETASSPETDTLKTQASVTTQEVTDTLKVGVDLKFPPFSYIDENGDPAGFEVDVANAFGEFMGKEVEIVNTDFSLLIPALETGDVDILIADMAKTDERSQKVDFSVPYRYSYTLALVNKDFANLHNITDEMPEDEFFALDDTNFVGLSGTKGVYYPQSKGVDVTEVTEIGTGLIEVSQGFADVLIASNEVHSFHAADPENTIVYGGIKAQDASNFAVRKGDSEMLDKANEFIASMYEDGGLYDQMAEEYDPIIAEFLHNDDLGLSYIVNPTN
ncbi:hypothetical protein AN644_01515 [Candidatus Epulonipiscium fishelsonii]|nr:hypothetical protein AN644_01515 [Epulopiscium sp. SCG-C06WGA-EpuloA1]